MRKTDLHSRLLMYTADAVRAFMEDVTRIGRADDVAVMMFTESGRRDEVYVQAFPSLEGKWQTSTGGGSQPVWSRGGDELF